jgi:hypothetical protein
MRPLNDREKRTVRIGGLSIAIYLVLFFGLQVWKQAQRQRDAYRQLLRDATALREKLTVYADKASVTGDLMEQFKFDPAKISRATLVAEATAAIHQSALSGGMQLGPIRETPARAAARELSAVQLEGMGPVPAVLRFLETVGNLGFPLVADSLQLSPAPGGPGMVKMTVTLVILDFDQWKANQEKPHA